MHNPHVSDSFVFVSTLQLPPFLLFFLTLNRVVIAVPPCPACALSLSLSHAFSLPTPTRYAGLSAACELRRLGYAVTVVEKNEFVGGRAHQFEATSPLDPTDVFTFDAGPSWYWMPDIFDQFFAQYGRDRTDFYSLTRLDPAYRVVLGPDATEDIPGTWEAFRGWADARSPENSLALQIMMEEAKQKYDRGIHEWVYKPMVANSELFDVGLLQAGLEYDMLSGFTHHIKKFVTDDLITTILKWPVIFLGSSPDDAPALYSMITYAGHVEGTWYPDGGMARPANAMRELAESMGVEFLLGKEVSSMEFEGNDRVKRVCGKSWGCLETDAVVGSGDYHYIEQTLLPDHLRNYDETYWERQVLSPSCLVFYLGLNKKVEGLIHHTFFFDEDLEAHLRAAFVDHEPWDRPAFYVSATSKTDTTVAPEDGESLFVLVPLSYQLDGTDNAAMREGLLERILTRMEVTLGEPIRESIVYQRAYGPSDFEQEYHAFRGNAFGHANLLSQSLVLKPTLDSKAANVVFAGHLTSPGPGVPPAIVSGNVAAKLLHHKLKGGGQDSSGMFEAAFGLLRVGGYAVVLFHVGALAYVMSSTRVSSYMTCARFSIPSAAVFCFPSFLFLGIFLSCS
jgi:phytoene desaturase